MIRTLSNGWVDRPWIDWLLTVMICGATFGFDFSVFVAEKGAFYQTAAGFALAILSLSAVAVTLVVTVTPTNRLRMAMDGTDGALVSILFDCLFSMFASATCYLLLFFVNPADHVVIWNLTLVASSAILLLRSTRLLWLLGRILMLLA